MKIKEIITKKDKDLETNLKDLGQSLTKLRFEIATRESKKSSEVRNIKRTIARIKTIQKERELQRKEESNEKKA